MKFELKFYKFYKLKSFLKTNPLFFIYHSSSLDTKNWKVLEQKLTKLKLNCYKIHNNILTKIIMKSVLKNIVPLINGPILIVSLKKRQLNELNFKKMSTLHPSLQLISFKLNNKCYTLEQIKNLQNLSFEGNVTILKRLIKNLNKISSYKLKKIN